MQTLQQSYKQSYLPVSSHPTLVSSFFKWCEGQEKYRFGWLAIVLATHGCILAPVTLLAISMTGNNLPLFMVTGVSMGMALVSNLAAMPTRITIPVYFASVVINLSVIAISIAKLF